MAEPTTGTATRRRYTGWKVVGANSVVWSLQSMVWVQGFGNLAVELRDQFGWSKTFLSVVFGATRAEIALIGPVQGREIQRRGVGPVMRAGAIASAAGFVAVAVIDNRAQFLLAMLLLAIGMSLVGFLTISAATVAWFEKRRARALSMQTMGFALGGFAAPIMVWGFQTIGWRGTVLVVGAVLSSAAWWAAGITGRRPEDTGEPMDGLTTAEADATPNAEGSTGRHLTAQQALGKHSDEVDGALRQAEASGATVLGAVRRSPSPQQIVAGLHVGRPDGSHLDVRQLLDLLHVASDGVVLLPAELGIAGRCKEILRLALRDPHAGQARHHLCVPGVDTTAPAGTIPVELVDAFEASLERRGAHG